MKKENNKVEKLNTKKPQKSKVVPENTNDSLKPDGKIIPHNENLFSKEVFPIVGIGASAGGLAAIESFLNQFLRTKFITWHSLLFSIWTPTIRAF
jgi:chemotaxis response regulator CheB